MTIEALSEQVILRDVETKVGGVVISAAQKNLGEIVSVAGDVNLLIGDVVYYDKRLAMEIRHDGEPLYIAKYNNILARIKKEAT